MTKNSIVLYKSTVAVVVDRDGDKYQIRFCTQPATPTGKKAVYGEQKVREKDVVLLHEGPVSSLEKVLDNGSKDFTAQINDAYELLQSDESTATAPIEINELAEYALGSFDADVAWGFYCNLTAGVQFAVNQDELKNGKIIFVPRSLEEINSINQKNYEKEHEAEIRAAFINRVKTNSLDLPADAKFMGEVEAFAMCKTEKSKVMQEAGITQTIEKAHKLLNKLIADGIKVDKFEIKKPTLNDIFIEKVGE